jgi:acyl-CoA thioester hydrolase
MNSDDKIESLRITTRGYEVSSTGSVPPAQFLRYLEHIRWRTIASSEKIPLRQFFFLGVVRSQVVEILEDVFFDAELELTVWLSRLGKTSMDLSHDVIRVSDGACVARSTATLVALDSNRRPSPIPEAARKYVSDRAALPPARLDGAPPDSGWERAVGIRPSDQDMQQHVNHARYAEFVEDTRFLCAASGGYGQGSWDGPARSLSIAYEHETKVGDPVIARTVRTEGDARSVDVFLMNGQGQVTTRARVGLRR